MPRRLQVVILVTTERNPTYGPAVCAFIEGLLVASEGDLRGEPARLMPFQRKFIWELYEYDPLTGLLTHKKALLGIARGGGKSQLSSWIACAELFRDLWMPREAGGVSPNVCLAAASWDQANILLSGCRVALEEGPLASFVECYEGNIQRKDGQGTIFRIAAVGPTAQGLKPTCMIVDELHAISGQRAEVVEALLGALGKRLSNFLLSISTAGSGLETAVGEWYLAGKAVERGEVDDPSYLFRWYEAPESLDFWDDEQFLEGIRAANPAAGVFRDINSWLTVRSTMDEASVRRYAWNQFVVGSEQSWVKPDWWRSCADVYEAVIEPGATAYIGIDAANSNDTTAVVVVAPMTVVTDAGEPEVVYRAQARIFELPEGDDAIDLRMVGVYIRELCELYDVKGISYDPAWFQQVASDLYDDGYPMLRQPQSPARMIPACMNAFQLIAAKRVRHSGEVAFTRHVLSARQRFYDNGWTIRKGRPQAGESPVHIDAAIALVLALGVATNIWSKNDTDLRVPASHAFTEEELLAIDEELDALDI